ncbi:MAG: porin family protein, partial [Bacteroidota bacterium]
ISCLIVLAAATSFAQNTAIGLRVGTTYFTLNNDEINEEAKSTLGVDLAIPVEFRISSVFSVQPELHFTQKGVQFEDVVNGEDQTIAVKTNYLELPVLIKANFGAQRLKGYAFIAPSVGYATNRFLSEKLGDADRVKKEVEFIETEAAKSRRWDFSAIGGVGASLQAGVGAIVMDVRYSFGLSDNTKFNDEAPDDWEKTTNRGCTLSVGYMLPIGGK